jgi:hypothetical protein
MIVLPYLPGDYFKGLFCCAFMEKSLPIPMAARGIFYTKLAKYCKITAWKK